MNTASCPRSLPVAPRVANESLKPPGETLGDNLCIEASGKTVGQSLKFHGDRDRAPVGGFAGVPAVPGERLLPLAEQQLVDYITANKLSRPTVIGHSLGGFLGMKLASDFPDKVGRLVIIDALPALGATRNPGATAEQLQAVAAQIRDGMRSQDDAAFKAMQERSAAGLVTSPEHAQRIASWGKQSDRATVTDAMYDIMSSDLRQDISRIKAPTLVLGTWVAYKAVAPKQAIEALFKSQYAGLPGARVELADTARHFVMYDEPEWMYARIDQFLQ